MDQPPVAVYLCALCDVRVDGLGVTETDRQADATQRHTDTTAELAGVDHEPDFVLVAGPTDDQRFRGHSSRNPGRRFG